MPFNVLVQDSGSAVRSDLSPAKLATPEAWTNPQINIFRYHAPEVILGRPISEACDVYSSAMTALEIITGGYVISHLEDQESRIRQTPRGLGVVRALLET